jgi:hypothetical protein
MHRPISLRSAVASRGRRIEEGKLGGGAVRDRSGPSTGRVGPSGVGAGGLQGGRFLTAPGRHSLLQRQQAGFQVALPCVCSRLSLA